MIRDSIVLIIMDFIFSTVSQNTWIGDYNYWWRSTSDFTPMHSIAYGTLILRDALYMEFDIVFNGPTPSNWQNVFRVGFPSYNGDCENHNSRYPSLWMLPDANKWHFSVSETSLCGKQWGSQPTATIGFKYHVIIHYNETNIFISLNDIVYIDTVRTATKPELIGRTMYVYISTDETGTGQPIPSANVTMSNIAIVSYSYNDGFTIPPTYAPTDAPSKYPTTYPTNPPTQSSLHPTTHPTIDPTHNPSSDPTNEPTLDPTVDPTRNPSVNPTSNPTKNPSKAPTRNPSTHPSRYPTTNPSTSPTKHPTLIPTLSPSTNPTTTPSLVPSFSGIIQLSSSDPTTMPTYHPSTPPIWVTESEEPILTLIKYRDDTDIDPLIALVIENLIYIGIALLACFAICCPVLSIWCCCYVRLCPTNKEGDERDHSESDNAAAAELFVDQEEAAGEREDSSGSSWTIPIKRVMQKDMRSPDGHHKEDIALPEFAGLVEGDGDITDEDFMSDSEDNRTTHLELQRERDRAIRQQQMRSHQDRFLGHNMNELYRVSTQSPVSHLDDEIQDDLVIFRDNEDVDEDDEKRICLSDLVAYEKSNAEGDVTEPEFAGHGGMGVTSMDLEAALDDGLSIVPSSGQFERSEKDSVATEARPGSRMSQSTISTSYKPRKTHPYHPRLTSNHSGGSSGSHSTPTTIDEEKEIDAHYYQAAAALRGDDANKPHLELKVDVNSPPIRHITRHIYNDRTDIQQHAQVERLKKKGRKHKKQSLNRNGNPFIPKHELEYYKRNKDNDDASSDSEYTDEYYDEDSEKEDDIVHDLQMQMDRARLNQERQKKEKQSNDQLTHFVE